jgi:DNA-binding NarL/FixJ family response regulator
MVTSPAGTARRVLIVSSHPLFGEGLRRLLEERREARVEVVGLVASTAAALAAVETLAPDLIVVDYDDAAVEREAFLARFVSGADPLRVVMLSLAESGPAVVYERRPLAVTQVEDWLA